MFEIRRERRRSFNVLSGYRVAETEDHRVKTLSLQMERACSSCGISFISQQRMMDICHMDSDLMCPAGLQTAFHVGVIPVSLKHMDMCHRGLSVRRHGHFFAVFRVSAHRSVNGQIIFPDCSVNNRPVSSRDTVFFQLLRDGLMRVIILADNNRTCLIGLL